MKFPDYVKNKFTKFSCVRGDEYCDVTYDYDIEGVEDFIKAFETIAKFLGYSENTLRDYYRDFDLSNANNDPELRSDYDDDPI